MPPRSFRWAIVLCRFSDKPTETRPKAYYEDFYTRAGGGGVCDYWRAVTENAWDLGQSQVFGWFQMGHASAEVSQLKFPAARHTLVQWGRDTAAANGVSLAGFDNVLVVLNFGIDHGATDNGVVIVDQTDGLCEFGFICHEMGHGHGLVHSWSANPDTEYGDAWDLMSFATATPWFDIAFEGRSGEATVGLNAHNVEMLQAVPSGRLWSPSPDFSQQLVLQPLGQPPIGNLGYLVAKILPESTRPSRPNGSSYTVEFRREAGWDRVIPRDAVLVHEVRTNGRSYLPESYTDYVVGDQFTTPDPKVWIRVTAIDATSETATIRVWDAPNGSVRKEDSDPKVYLIESGAKRWLTTPAALTGIGKTWADVRSVPDGGLDWIPEGPDIYVPNVSVTPFPVPVNTPVTVTFAATDSSGGALDGIVHVDGTAIGHTNTALSHQFATTRRQVGRRWVVEYPTVIVTVWSFPTVEVDCGWP
jgi:hypothetical protein